MPSTTIGYETIPIPLSISRNHARPRPLTFLSVTSLSGLKCCSSKVRPFSNQLSPSVASDIARASLTLPALVWLSAEERTAMVNGSARHRAVRPRTCHFLIGHLFWSSQDVRGHHSMPLPPARWGQPPSAVRTSEARLVFVCAAKPGRASLRLDSRGRLSPRGSFLLQPEAFVHQPLQSRLVKNVEGEFFVGKHGQGVAFGAGRQF